MKKNLLTIILSLAVTYTGTLFAVDNAAAPNTKPATAPTVPAQVVPTNAPMQQDQDDWQVRAMKDLKNVPMQQDQDTKVAIDTVIQAVKKAHLENVKSIELDDGQWEVKTQSGETETKYIFNQQNSQLTKAGQEREDCIIPLADFKSLQNAVKTVQGDSYTVKGVDSEGGAWKVKAFDNKGQKYEIFVDKNGDIALNYMDD